MPDGAGQALERVRLSRRARQCRPGIPCRISISRTHCTLTGVEAARQRLEHTGWTPASAGMTATTAPSFVTPAEAGAQAARQRRNTQSGFLLPQEGRPPPPRLASHLWRQVSRRHGSAGRRSLDSRSAGMTATTATLSITPAGQARQRRPPRRAHPARMGRRAQDRRSGRQRAGALTAYPSTGQTSVPTTYRSNLSAHHNRQSAPSAMWYNGGAACTWLTSHPRLTARSQTPDAG